MIWDDLQRIRREAPLVHNITNYVVMNVTANALLAVGASPVMAHAIEEVTEMVGLSRALVLNIGTLSPAWIDAMLAAGRAARDRGTPVVLDPVGAGATRFRTDTARRLLEEVAPTIVRGNASEILALAGGGGATRGVDSTHGTEAALDAACALAKAHGCVVSISGAVDLVVDADRVARVANGVPLMTRITGTGCTASAITGAFAAVNSSAFHAAAHAMGLVGVVGELAAARAGGGTASLQLHMIDLFGTITEPELSGRLRMEGA